MGDVSSRDRRPIVRDGESRCSCRRARAARVPRRLRRGCAGRPGARAWQVSIALVSDARMRALNRTIPRQGPRRPTSFSFPSLTIRGRANPGRRPEPPSLLGDIVIARGVARRQARAAGHSELTELRCWRCTGSCTCSVTITSAITADARVEQRLRRKGGLREGLIERGRSRDDPAAEIFLSACAAVYLGAIEAAFSALMRLSLRLVAERSGRPGALGQYLDDPLLLFVPVRLLLGSGHGHRDGAAGSGDRRRGATTVRPSSFARRRLRRDLRAAVAAR